MRSSEDVDELLKIMKLCSFINNQNVDVTIIKRLIKDKSFRRFANVVTLNAKSIDTTTAIEKGLDDLKKYILLLNSLHSRIIFDLKSMIEETDFEIILLKSSAFNFCIYQEDEIRSSADIDILVKVENKLEFEELISNIAFKVTRPKTPFENLYEETWKLKKKNIYIDIHYNIANPNLFSINVKSLFDNSKQHPNYQSEKIRVLAPEHALIHMGLHMFTDCNFLHHSLVDACNIYIRTNIDLEYCNNIAKEWGCSKIFGFLLYMLNYSFNLNLENCNNNLIAKYISLHIDSSSEFVRRTKQITFQYCLTDKTCNVLNNQFKYLYNFIYRVFK